MKLIRFIDADDPAEAIRQITALRSAWSLGQPYLDTVRIVEDVRANGDEALVRYSSRFDNYCGDIVLNECALRTMAERADTKFVGVAKKAADRLRAYSESVLSLVRRTASCELDLAEIQIRLEPIRDLGIYVPKGKATYVSTLLMAGVPAVLCGVARIQVCTPPADICSLSNFAHICTQLGIKEAYLVGGAHAVAALAYGTQTVRKVDKIVGPGGTYVTMAKHYVSKDVAIDFLAGPTELLVLADGSADPRNVALDLLSQAEHGSDAWVGLVTDSSEFRQAVSDNCDSIAGITKAALPVPDGKLWAAVLPNLGEAAELAERLAPEHLQLVGRRAEGLSGTARNAALVLIGNATPSSATDYFLGPNHVLPTLGIARSRGGLSPLDFLKLTVKVKGTAVPGSDLKDIISTFAAEEGFPYHSMAVRDRNWWAN